MFIYVYIYIYIYVIERERFRTSPPLSSARRLLLSDTPSLGRADLETEREREGGRDRGRERGDIGDLQRDRGAERDSPAGVMDGSVLARES